MAEVEFSDEFCQFLQAVVPAVDAAELLLFIADRPDLWWDLDQALNQLKPGVNITRADAERYLDAFAARGLIETQDRKFRYLAGTELAGHVRTLAQAYEERPVTLIRVIYAMRDSKIRTFAEAFRLRKK